jgi:hypothetical protein
MIAKPVQRFQMAGIPVFLAQRVLQIEEQHFGQTQPFGTRYRKVHLLGTQRLPYLLDLPGAGSKPGHLYDCCLRRFVSVSVRQNLATAQSSAPQRTAPALSLQKPAGTGHPGRLASFAAQGLACHLRAQAQPQTEWTAHRPNGFRLKAQALYPSSTYRCGREANAIMYARLLDVWKRFLTMSASFSPNCILGINPRRTS